MPYRQTRVIAAHEVELWSRRDGNPHAPCIILVAGANASHLMWPDEFCQRLVARNFCVIRYDHRATARSSRFDFATLPYSLADLCILLPISAPISSPCWTADRSPARGWLIARRNAGAGGGA